MFVDAGTETVSIGSATQTTGATLAINSSDSVLIPVGTTSNRPATGHTGMLRFNSQENVVEIYDNLAWTAVGAPIITVIVDDQFNGDGSTTVFTLSQEGSTAGTIVSINGVQQIPTTAYSVLVTTLTFTEAPDIGDLIDVRILTTTSSVTGLQNGTSKVTVLPSANVVTTVAGFDIATAYATGFTIAGDLTVTGNATLSGNILGDRIQNGTTSIDIQSAGGNANISIGGVSNVAVFATTGVNVAGALSATGNVTGSYIIGNGSLLTGLPAGYSNADVATYLASGTVSTAISTSSTISATGNITGGNVSATTFTGALSGAATSAGTAGTVTTAAQGNITSVGTLTALSVSGNVTAGNVAATTFTGALSGAATSATTAGTVTTAAQGNITSVGTLTALSVSGNVTAGNVSVGTGAITVGSIVNSNATGVGNIGSSSVTFNTIFAKATSAQYADLAEKYAADAEYAPGTVVAFGGDKEVTQANEADSTRVAGVISTNPSYIMNAALESEHVAMVALQGRVPCKVVGTVRKGDMMVAAGNGAAKVDNNARAGSIIGKALENFDGAEGTIEVVIGRN